MIIELIVLAAGACLGYANGANDVAKGVATLVGSGVSRYGRAIAWGTVWTAMGGLASLSLAWAMVATFGGGLLAADTHATFPAAVATIIAAAAWVFIATRSGLPVSTTHAIVGAIAGVGVAAYGLHGIRWSLLGTKVVLPLLASPFAAAVLTVLLLRLARRIGVTGPRSADCLCAGLLQVAALQPVGAMSTSASAMMAAEALPQLTWGHSATCAAGYSRPLRITLDRLHWLTSGATSFARGLNDAPKMVALMLAASALTDRPPVAPALMFAVVTVGMVVGSLVGGLRVTQLLAERVTPMDPGQGFVTNLVTATLVGLGAVLGLPMSTTHVASSAIIGVGAQGRTLNRSTVRDMLLAWIVTLPAAALLGVLVYGLAVWM